jgi:hypothetical protein
MDNRFSDRELDAFVQPLTAIALTVFAVTGAGPAANECEWAHSRLYHILQGMRSDGHAEDPEVTYFHSSARFALSGILEPGVGRTPPFQSDDVLIVLDWDDTLYPTTIGHEVGNNERMPFAAFRSVARMAMYYVLDFIDTASRIGRVVIVTAAEERWLSLTMDNMPIARELADRNVLIYSARDMAERERDAGRTDLDHAFQWKANVIEKLLRCHRPYALITIGDKIDEHLGAHIAIHRYSSTTPTPVASVVHGFVAQCTGQSRIYNFMEHLQQAKVALERYRLRHICAPAESPDGSSQSFSTNP